MTEEIASGRHHSSAEIDIARLKEKHTALKGDVADVKTAVLEVKGLLLAHITNANSQHSQLLAVFNDHKLEDSVVHQSVIRCVADVGELQGESKRDPVTFWTAVSAGAVAVGGAVAAVFGGKP